jgi:signal transduction histidine kinase
VERAGDESREGVRRVFAMDASLLSHPRGTGRMCAQRVDRHPPGAIKDSEARGTQQVSIAAMQTEPDTAVERGTQAPDGLARGTAHEAEIGRLHARIAQLEREKAANDAVLAVAAHELLTPVIMIDAYATMVSERLDEEHHADSRRDLDALHRGAARTRLLVETLLKDVQSQGRELRRRSIDLNLLVRECLTLLAPEIRSRDAQVQVTDLPHIRGEEALISAVFSNLLVNALKYGPREHGTILVDAAPDTIGWRLSVQSQGPPILPADRDRIFEPYHRGRGERRAQGAGLGLAICRSIVERHGGQIGVLASDGGDNHFYFTLPA